MNDLKEVTKTLRNDLDEFEKLISDINKSLDKFDANVAKLMEGLKNVNDTTA